MALFSRSKKTEEVAATTKVAAPKKAGLRPLATDRNLATVIVGPRITEKAMGMSDKNVYVFKVRSNATKFHVRDAIKALYNVTPVRVNIVNRAPAIRHSGSRNRDVKVPGMKKAYVYLKKGDSINLV